MNTITVEYNKIQITYDESTNRWEFELRGRDRFSESLAKAKEAIDKPVPADKPEPTFKPVLCWKGRWSDEWIQFTVTSIAGSKYGRQEVWASNEKTARSKHPADEMHPCNPHNDAIVAEIQRANRALAEMRKQRDDLVD